MSSMSQQNKLETQQKKPTNVGATWTNSGNLNIDLDNLMGMKKNKQSAAPTMNQMASNPASPINHARVMPQINPAPFGVQNYQQQPFGQPNNQFYPNFK